MRRKCTNVTTWTVNFLSYAQLFLACRFRLFRPWSYLQAWQSIFVGFSSVLYITIARFLIDLRRMFRICRRRRRMSFVFLWRGNWHEMRTRLLPPWLCCTRKKSLFGINRYRRWQMELRFYELFVRNQPGRSNVYKYISSRIYHAQLGKCDKLRHWN